MIPTPEIRSPLVIIKQRKKVTFCGDVIRESECWEAIREANKERREEGIDSKLMYYEACAATLQKDTEMKEPTKAEKEKWKKEKKIYT